MLVELISCVPFNIVGLGNSTRTSWLFNCWYRWVYRNGESGFMYACTNIILGEGTHSASLAQPTAIFILYMGYFYCLESIHLCMC